MTVRRFTEYVVAGKTFYKNVEGQARAFKYAQDLANSQGSPVRMEIVKGWIQEDPSGFVYDSEETSRTTKTFKPKGTLRAGNPSLASWIPAKAVRIVRRGKKLALQILGGKTGADRKIGREKNPGGWVKVSPARAKKVYAEGGEVLIARSNINEYHLLGGWHLGFVISLARHGDWASIIRNYKYYNSEPELGRGMQYWIKERTTNPAGAGFVDSSGRFRVVAQDPYWADRERREKRLRAARKKKRGVSKTKSRTKVKGRSKAKTKTKKGKGRR